MVRRTAPGWAAARSRSLRAVDPIVVLDRDVAQVRKRLCVGRVERELLLQLLRGLGELVLLPKQVAQTEMYVGGVRCRDRCGAELLNRSGCIALRVERLPGDHVRLSGLWIELQDGAVLIQRAVVLLRPQAALRQSQTQLQVAPAPEQHRPVGTGSQRHISPGRRSTSQAGASRVDPSGFPSPRRPVERSHPPGAPA